jgi:hypothetical protein
MHNVSTFKMMQFAPLLNDIRKKFPGDCWQDTELGCQAIREDFANGVIKGTHSLQSHEFVLWVYNESSLDQGEGIEGTTYNLQAFLFMKRRPWEVF